MEKVADRALDKEKVDDVIVFVGTAGVLVHILRRFFRGKCRSVCRRSFVKVLGSLKSILLCFTEDKFVVHDIIFGSPTGVGHCARSVSGEEGGGFHSVFKKQVVG